MKCSERYASEQYLAVWKFLEDYIYNNNYSWHPPLFLPSHSKEWSTGNFSKQRQYIILQTDDENQHAFISWNVGILTKYQILSTIKQKHA